MCTSIKGNHAYTYDMVSKVAFPDGDYGHNCFLFENAIVALK